MTESRVWREEDSGKEERRNTATSHAVRYEILASRLTQDGVDYLSYGIRCMADREGTWIQLDAVLDISFQREVVADLVDLFNRRQLSGLHFREAILDRLNA